MNIQPKEFYKVLTDSNINFFTGVPDSLLKEFCLCIDNENTKSNHVIAANEGSAVAIATGNYLSTGEIPLVYMQNSGLGNAINPLLSLCDADVYSIPMLVMIGWRGEPGKNDEPQHIKQGKVQIEILKALEIPFKIIDKHKFLDQLKSAIKISKKKKIPYVLLIKKGTFDKYEKLQEKIIKKGLNRESALEVILQNLDDKTIIISTTGKTSREIFEIREKNKQSHEKDFLTVGSMGHCSSIALGVALANHERKIVCIDGDGSMLMHMGALTTISSLKPKNFYHILMNNKVHESVGGQSTAAKEVSLSKVVHSTGINNIFYAKNKIDLKNNMKLLMNNNGPSFLEVEIIEGSREDLGRPHIKPIKNKIDFMNFIK